jgi:hypothetical protein
LAEVATKTHPSSKERNPVVRRGYGECLKTRKLEDAKKPETGFGIGAAMRRKTKKVGCWSFWFRTAEDVNSMGPIAAPRKRSRYFEGKLECESTRKKRTQTGEITSEPCECSRGSP